MARSGLASRNAREQSVEQILVDVVGQSTLDASRIRLHSVPSGDVELLSAAARMHGVEAWIAACAPLQQPAWRGVAEQRARMLAARMRVSAVLEDLTAVFHAAGCPWLVLKGPALEYSIYPRPDLRHSVDLDVLISPTSFSDAIELLEREAGFTLLDRNWPVLERLLPGQLRIRSPRGILVDLHWSVLNDPKLRKRFCVPTAMMLSSTRSLDPPGIPALCPAEQLVHLGMHASLAGANRLGWLLDAHLAATKIDDWRPVIALAEQTRSARLLALVLNRAEQLWRTGVPPEVHRALAGGGVTSSLDHIVNGVRLTGRDPQRPALGRAWARSMRATLPKTFVELGRHGAGWLSGHIRPGGGPPLLDERNPNGPLFPVDNRDARRRYMTMVSSSD